MKYKLLLLMLVLTASKTFSQTTFTFNGIGDWTNTANWSLGNYPGTTVDANEIVEIYGKVTDASNFYGVKFIREEEIWKNQSVMQITGAATKNDAYNLIQTDSRFIDTLNSIPYRHPAQLYEAFSYIFVFAILFFLYWKTDSRKKQGFIFGMFMILLWSIRFVVEFVKASQGGFEGDDPILSTGQWLSIPMILVGIYYVFTSKKTEIV